jgi:hypothetical protein
LIALPLCRMYRRDRKFPCQLPILDELAGRLAGAFVLVTASNNGRPNVIDDTLPLETHGTIENFCSNS